MIEVIESLPEEYQFVLRAHYLGNKSSEEIAAILGVPAESVARIIKAGKAALAREIGL
ncbi:MAG: sigma-70 family RNA polymerase sigma factor [Candidatus Nanopelagicaceae bacterium]|nr:sigma-70 family RNA polymerase sigma factor [Candidatus Nanopelagicaceae bacterium]